MMITLDLMERKFLNHMLKIKLRVHIEFFGIMAQKKE